MKRSKVRILPAPQFVDVAVRGEIPVQAEAIYKYRHMAWSSNGIGTQTFNLLNAGSTPVHATRVETRI